MFGGTKVSKAVSQAEAAGSAINGADWKVKKTNHETGADYFALAVVASGVYLWYAWRKMKRQKGK